MPLKKKSWVEKLQDSKDLPKVEKITADKSQRWGTGTFVVPAPLEVDEIMRKVRKQVVNFLGWHFRKSF